MLLSLIEENDSANLRHRFNNQDTRHHGSTRKVPTEEVVVNRHTLNPYGTRF